MTAPERSRTPVLIEGMASSTKNRIAGSVSSKTGKDCQAVAVRQWVNQAVRVTCSEPLAQSGAPPLVRFNRKHQIRICLSNNF